MEDVSAQMVTMKLTLKTVPNVHTNVQLVTPHPPTVLLVPKTESTKPLVTVQMDIITSTT